MNKSISETRWMRIIFTLVLLVCAIELKAQDIRWGEATNHLRAGVAFLEGYSSNLCAVYIQLDANNNRRLYYPAVDEMFSITLKRKENSGNSLALRSSKPLSRATVPGRSKDSIPNIIGRPIHAGSFLINELFKDLQEGEYDMEVVLRVYEAVGGKNYLSTHSLPCVRTSIHITANKPTPPKSSIK